ncbi:hypothetical protein [Streptomyces sp. NPDC086787]|uniref:hypothetical protein n=1 Tax=Streptomyces sp. NPDC086787 TaxID=3365759 RepID=UPI0037F80F29
MKRMIGKAGDKILGALLKEQRAGACVPEAGDFCMCKKHVEYIITCYGPCVKFGKC